MADAAVLVGGARTPGDREAITASRRERLADGHGFQGRHVDGDHAPGDGDVAGSIPARPHIPERWAVA
jgi:hypothetical protein